MTLLGLAALVGGLLAVVGLGLALLVRRVVVAGAGAGGRVAGAAGFLLLVAALRLLVVAGAGSDVPFWDQWDAEPPLHAALAAGHVPGALLLAPHMEHRVLWTRALLGLLQGLDGGWSARLQMTAGALLHALAGLAVAAAAARSARPRDLAAAGALALLALGVPFAWENALWGFQVHFELELLLGALAVGLAAGARPGGAPWLAGLACAACGLLALAGGALAPAALALVAAAGALRRRPGWGRAAAAVLPPAALAAAGVLLAVRVPGVEALGARTPLAFLRALGQCAAWPWVERPWLAPLLWVPWGLAAARWLRAPAARPREAVPVALGAWVLLHAAAMAWARGAGPPAWRYLDLLAVGAVVNGSLALGWALGARPRPAARALALAWVALAVAGGVRLGARVVRRELPAAAAARQRQAAEVRAFLATGDPAALRDPAGQPAYPDPQRLALLLGDPAIRARLPAAARPGAPRGPLAAAAEALLARAPLLAAAGAALVAGALLAAAGAALAAARRRAAITPAGAPPPGTAGPGAPR